MTYTEALNYLDTFTNYERLVAWPAHRDFRLDRMEQLLVLLGRPHRQFRCLLVGGTKGKGSTCAILYAILGELRQPVGLYTSPHLSSVRERIRVQQGVSGMEGEDWIGEAEFAALVREAQPAIDAVHGSPSLGPLTYFEILTALAFLHFARRRVAYAALEVGLGGRLDATNVVTPDVAVLTPISLDHTDVLGGSVAAIAAEKAGIIKPRGCVILARQPPPAQQVIEEAIVVNAASVRREGVDFLATDVRVDRHATRATLTGWFGAAHALTLPLLGVHQAQNASLAVAAVELLRERGLALPPAAIVAGAHHARWPGRCELFDGTPSVLLDGAQNAASAEALAQTVTALTPRTPATIVLGVSQPKDIAGIVRALAPITGTVIATQARHPRAYPAATVAQATANAGLRVSTQPDMAMALAAARRETSPEGLIVVTGSLFLVGEARTLLLEPAQPRVSQGGSVYADDHRRSV